MVDFYWVAPMKPEWTRAEGALLVLLADIVDDWDHRRLAMGALDVMGVDREELRAIAIAADLVARDNDHRTPAERMAYVTCQDDTPEVKDRALVLAEQMRAWRE